jgi:hypothetical protein
MGGAFLSQPVTDKRVNKYQHGKIRVITCEMQGKVRVIKVGVNTWRTLCYFTGSVKISSCLQSSTGTVAYRSLSFALRNCQKCCRGMIISRRATTGRPSRSPSGNWTICWVLSTGRRS